MAYASFKYLSDRERKRVEKERQKKEQERLRKYLRTLEKKSRVKHDKVYRAPNRASGNTKSIHPDVREQYYQEQQHDFNYRELTENPLPSLDDLTPLAPSQFIEDYYKLNPREPVTNTKETKQGQEKMSRQLREKGFGHRYWEVTKEKIDPEKVLRTRKRNKGGRKNKTRRRKKKGGGKKEIIEINKNKEDIRRLKRDIFKIKQELDNILISPEEDDTYDKLPASAFETIDKIRSASPTSVGEVPMGGKRKTRKNRKKKTRRRRKNSRKKKNRKKRTKRR